MLTREGTPMTDVECCNKRYSGHHPGEGAPRHPLSDEQAACQCKYGNLECLHVGRHEESAHFRCSGALR